jgi:hypothetical protein
MWLCLLLINKKYEEILGYFYKFMDDLGFAGSRCTGGSSEHLGSTESRGIFAYYLGTSSWHRYLLQSTEWQWVA